MRNPRQIFWVILLVLVSIAILFGILSLSQAEGTIHLPIPTLSPSSTPSRQSSPSQGSTPTPLIIYICPTAVPYSCPLPLPPTPPPTWTPTSTPTSIPSSTPTWTLTGTLAWTPTRISTWTPTRIFTWTPTPTSSPTNCPTPSGWVAYYVRSGDTLETLALRYKITSAAISQGNCLGTVTLLPGQVIYLPPLSTHTPVPCGAPHTWIIYVVQKGDTLYHLGQIYGIPYTVIQRANCLPNFNIRIGQLLYVPPWAPVVPFPTIFYDPFLPTEISTFYLPFETPETETPTPTYDPAAGIPTGIVTPTEIPTLTPTEIPPTP
ncbi:MAG TPA: LysM peptidoglycan-binding domain-containing protein [Anaerolineales bacterium]